MLPTQTPSPLPIGIVRETLDRVRSWESTVEPSRWSPYAQQLRLAPDPLTSFSIHRDCPSRRVRFRGLEGERQVWLSLLPKIEVKPGHADAFRDCGRPTWIELDTETGEYYTVASTCKLRVCPACRKRVQYLALARMRRYLDQHPDGKWQLITLTLRHNQTGLGKQLDRLTRSFRKLRQRKLWKTSVVTGYAAIEMTRHAAWTYRPNGQQREQAEWHPHLHILARTDWIDWSKLRSDWLGVTGDSNNIDCQHARNTDQAARYLAKYLGKPPKLDLQADPEAAEEYYLALNGRRLLIPFGGTSADTPPPAPAPRRSERICNLDSLYAAALGGDYPAQSLLTRILLAMTRKQPPIRAEYQTANLPFTGPPP